MNTQQQISALSIDAERRVRLLRTQCEGLALRIERQDKLTNVMRELLRLKREEIADIVGPEIKVHE